LDWPAHLSHHDFAVDRLVSGRWKRAPFSICWRAGSTMNIRQLEAFRATMLAGTVSGAASLMGLSQPAISRLLSQLEASLKLALFDRSKGRLMPTPEAHLLYEEVERTFVSVEKIRELARDIRDARAGQLRIAVLPALALSFLPDAIARFNATHPKIFISLTIEASVKVEEWVAAQQVDFGIAEFPFFRAGIEVEDFCRSELVLVVPIGHRLASAPQGVVTAADLRDENLVSLSPSTTGRHLADRAFERLGVRCSIVAEARYSAAICGLIERGLGIGLVDPFTASDFVRRERLVALRFQPAIEFRLGLLIPAHRPMSVVAREFLKDLGAIRNLVLREMPPVLAPATPREGKRAVASSGASRARLRHNDSA
jgi:DNA-binding transcriptional LysR family regulator